MIVGLASSIRSVGETTHTVTRVLRSCCHVTEATTWYVHDLCGWPIQETHAAFQLSSEHNRVSHAIISNESFMNNMYYSSCAQLGACMCATYITSKVLNCSQIFVCALIIKQSLSGRHRISRLPEHKHTTMKLSTHKQIGCTHAPHRVLQEFVFRLKNLMVLIYLFFFNSASPR